MKNRSGPAYRKFGQTFINKLYSITLVTYLLLFLCKNVKMPVMKRGRLNDFYILLLTTGNCRFHMRVEPFNRPDR
jgi:hypothetical protein